MFTPVKNKKRLSTFALLGLFMIFSMLVTSTVEAQTLGDGQITETLAIASPDFTDTVGDGLPLTTQESSPTPDDGTEMPGGEETPTDTPTGESTGDPTEEPGVEETQEQTETQASEGTEEVTETQSPDETATQDPEKTETESTEETEPVEENDPSETFEPTGDVTETPSPEPEETKEPESSETETTDPEETEDVGDGTETPEATETEEATEEPTGEPELLAMTVVPDGGGDRMAGSGSIWTTDSSCQPQNINQYTLGQQIWIRADNFWRNSTYSWSIKEPGHFGATVVSGRQTTNNQGYVCFYAYTFTASDTINNPYSVKFSNKNDNFSVVVPTPEPGQPLNLEVDCVEDGSHAGDHIWTVSNPNAFDIDYWWSSDIDSQDGYGSVDGGQTDTFYTSGDPQSVTISYYYPGEENDRCGGGCNPNPHTVTVTATDTCTTDLPDPTLSVLCSTDGSEHQWTLTNNSSEYSLWFKYQVDGGSWSNWGYGETIGPNGSKVFETPSEGHTLKMEWQLGYYWGLGWWHIEESGNFTKTVDSCVLQPTSPSTSTECQDDGKVTVTFSGLTGVASLTWGSTTYDPDDWSTGSFTISDLTTGTYDYSWTGQSGYTGGSDSVTVTECTITSPQISTQCIWDDQANQSLVTVTFSSLTGVASLTWDGGTPLIPSGDPLTISIPNVTPGTYSYSWTGAEGYTGGSVDVYEIVSCIPASVTIDQTCVWNGETSFVDVTLTGLTGIASITWNNGTTYTPNSSEWDTQNNKLTISDVDPGTYTYSWTSAEGYTGGESDVSIKVLSCQPLDLSVTCLADGQHEWTISNQNNYGIDIEWKALSRDETDTFSESNSPVTVPSNRYITVQTTPKSQLFRVTYNFDNANANRVAAVVSEMVEAYAEACVLEPIVDYNCRDFDNSHMWSIENENSFDILVQWRFNDDSFTDSWVTIAAGATYDLPASSSSLQTLHVQYRYADETIYNASPVTAEECKTSGLDLSFICGYPSDTELYWQVENPFGFEIEFTWEVEGSDPLESGTETVGASGSVNFDTSLGDKNVILYVNGNKVDQAESGEACYEDLELDFQCLPTGLHEWTVTNNNDFDQSFDWSSTNGESDDDLLVKANESITFTTGLELQTVTVSYEHEIFEKEVEMLAEACKSPELDLVYDCGYPTDSALYWYISNPLDVDIDFDWEVVGGTEKGSVTAMANAKTYFTTSTGTKSVKILVEGYDIDMENGGESCMVELSLSYKCLDNGTQEWTVTNLNKFDQPFDWSSDSGASGSGIAPAGGSYSFTTANLDQEITIEYKNDPFPAQSTVVNGEVCKLSTPEPPTTYGVSSEVGTCQEWIVFHTMRDGNMEVYRLDGIEGVGDFELFNLSNGDGIDARPSRSFNDAWVAFQSNRDGNYEIYYGDTAGNQQVRLTDNEADDINPMFSPDNTHIVFQSNRNGNWDLYMVNRLTGVETQLTDAESDEINPFFSNNQNFLVFETNKNRNQDIYLLNIVTGDEYKVATGKVDEVSPALSPNGQKVAFLSPVDGVMQLFVIDIDGSNKIQITDGDGDTNHHSWSPDSSRLAYQSVRDGNMDIYTFDLRDNAEYRVTNGVVDDIGPTWDCGGVNLSFTSTSASDDLNIYQAFWKGGASSQMTVDPATDQWSEWSPAKETASRDD
jgi:Tol biopolymer transport system component